MPPKRAAEAPADSDDDESSVKASRLDSSSSASSSSSLSPSSRHSRCPYELGMLVYAVDQERKSVAAHHIAHHIAFALTDSAETHALFARCVCWLQLASWLCDQDQAELPGDSSQIRWLARSLVAYVVWLGLRSCGAAR